MQAVELPALVVVSIGPAVAWGALDWPISDTGSSQDLDQVERFVVGIEDPG